MSRVQGGAVTRRRHKKILKMTKGQWCTKHRLLRRANEAMMKRQWYAYRDRSNRKHALSSLGITRSNAAAHLSGMSYSRLIHGLKGARIELDRKILADLAVRDPQTFASIVELAKQS